MNEIITSEDEHVFEDFDSMAMEEVTVMKQSYLDLERSCEIMTALENIHAFVNANGEITERELKLINIAAEMAVAGTDTRPDYIVNLSLSQEDFKERLVGVIEKIGNNINKQFKSIVTKFSNSTQLMVNLNSRYKKLSSKFDTIKQKSDSITIELSPNKWMMTSDTHGPRNFKEYISEYNKTSQALMAVMIAIHDLGLNKASKHFQLVADLFKLDPDKAYVEIFKDLEASITHAIKDSKSKQTKKTPIYTQYETEPLLGIAKFTFKIPNPSLYKHTDVESLEHVYKHFDLETDRDLTTSATNSIKFDINVNDLAALISEVEILLGVRKTTPISTIWSKMTNILMEGKLPISLGSLTKLNTIQSTILDSIGGAVIGGEELDVFGIYRLNKLMNKEYEIVATSGISARVVTFGNISNALDIIEKAIKTFEK